MHLLLQNAPECTIVSQFSKNFPGETPGPPPAGGGDPLPLSALRASVKPSASDLGAPEGFNRAPEEKKLDTPVKPTELYCVYICRFSIMLFWHNF